MTLSSTSTSYTGSSASNPSGYSRSSTSGNGWQTYGFSHFELDENLNLKKNNYIPALHATKDNKKGKINNLLTIGYNFDIYTLITEYIPKQNNTNPLLSYKIKDEL